MTERHVLVLALGATRRRAAVDDAARVVAQGGTATIVTGDAALWGGDRLARGVRLVDLPQLELRHAWMPLEQLVLYRIPRFAFRAVGRGPLKPWSQRAGKAYQRRIADPLHRRALLPLLRRGRGAAAAQLIRRHLDAAGTVDLLVVNDPASMPTAATLVESYGRSGSPRVAYGLDHAVPAGSTPPSRRDGGQSHQGDR